MKRLLTSAALLAALTAATASAQTRPIELGLTAGYASGLSGEVFVHAPNVAGPIGVKLSAAYTSPSDSIRDNVEITGLNSGLTLGTFGSFKSQGLATESGSHMVFGLDGTYNLGEVTPGVSALGYAGARYGMFRATETYADDATLSNTWTMNSFGVGAGAQLSYALAGNLSLVGDLGVDHYFAGTLSNGTANGTYAPGEAGYSDQRARFAFPGTVFKAKIGLKFSNF
ncbi:hypothetical protein D3875_10040 [Deinococcus cavernae]|uniref:Outer membrane protein beta-barrel domain-containing protein n=1 Tax=Deinococcus cavernae TaxID=2320857 RepID=A0A418V6W4_9DEIO|nr:hypothetical protein [Deinococcus cavernae]RJF71847.1 hypothetical protein D3875_10040 [Deinococcus cavernae]